MRWSRRTGRPPRGVPRRWRRRLLALLVALLALAGWELFTWPDVAALVEKNPETTAFIDRYRERTGAAPEWRWARYPAISPHLKRAVLVAEDIEFFSHKGFAVEEIKTAVRQTVQEGKPLRGASTITQQLAKNLWLTPSRNPWRKVKEAMLTRQLEAKLSKKRILEIYLNVVEFGPGVYGAEAAARRYFGCSAGDLTPRQAAALAAGLPKPRTWHPGSQSREYQRRVESVARRMEKAKWLEKVV